MARILAAAGETNNRLTLVRLHKKKRGGYLWVARCNCGKETIVTVRDFRSGHTKSCGCYRTELIEKLNLTHAMSESVEFRLWCHMIGRCYAKGDHKYPIYGARGITVCDRWLGSFESFYADMGPRPSAEYSIDRIDNNKGYSPANCRWATRTEQASNKRNNVHVLIYGKRVTVAEATRILGIHYGSINQRIRAFGGTHQDAADHFSGRRAKRALLGQSPSAGGGAAPPAGGQ